MRAAIVLILAIASAHEAYSGTLTLKNGRVIEAQEIRLEGDSYVVTLRNGNERSIPRRAVDETKTEGVANVEPQAPGSGAGKVYTNEDLQSEGSSETSSPGEARQEQRDDKRALAASEREEQKWQAWRDRYVRAQARVDTAQKEVDDLKAQADQVSGDIKTAGDGTKISGVRPGHGYCWKLDVAERKLTAAQAELDRLRQEADQAGVPPGIMR